MAYSAQWLQSHMNMSTLPQSAVSFLFWIVEVALKCCCVNQKKIISFDNIVFKQSNQWSEHSRLHTILNQLGALGILKEMRQETLLK